MALDLENVIEDAVQDATEPEAVEETPSQETQEAAPEPSGETTAETTEGEADSSEVASPAAKQEAAAPPVPDEFAKKHGLQPQAPGQRENRLPYSRVKKIVENAERKAAEPFQAQLAERDTKIKEYEERLTKVGEFEHIMIQEPAQFLEMLNKIPAYHQIFSQLERKGAAQPEAQAQAPAPVQDDMPQPDQKLPDGSMVYSMEGLKALNAWNREQAKREALAEVQKTYGPLQEQWEAQQRVQALLPQVERQIQEARSWPGFSDAEDAIVEALQKNPTMSLEGAYRHVVLPKLQAQAEAAKTDEKKLREEIRKQVLADLKKAPTSTSAPSQGVKPRPASTGPRSLEDVIAESIQGAGGR